MSLTPRQQRFVEEYVLDLNAAAAARRAGYSEKTSNREGTRLLSNVVIADAIRAALKARRARKEDLADRVVEELALIALSDLTAYGVRDDGRLVLRKGTPKDVRRAVSSIKQKRRVVLGDGERRVENVETEIKLWSKPDALRLLGQHLGLIPKVVSLATDDPPGAGGTDELDAVLRGLRAALERRGPGAGPANPAGPGAGGGP